MFQRSAHRVDHFLIMYRGRFAPSPTGPLHFGSLVTAVGSYLDARFHGGQWLVRMEDVDTPRNEPGAAAGILRMLEWYGFEWDGPVLFQSTRFEAYQEAIEQLKPGGLLFPCACSRKEIGEVYPGTCRGGLPEGKDPRSWRLRVDSKPIHFEGRLLGPQEEVLTEAVGDFVLKRADGLYAYQLAVVVDDGWQGVTDVVRGSDLLTSTARQIYLRQALELPKASYLHLPVVIDRTGDKLSKQTKAKPIPTNGPAAIATLAKAFEFLGHTPEGRFDSIEDAWSWVTPVWRAEKIPAVKERSIPDA